MCSYYINSFQLSQDLFYRKLTFFVKVPLDYIIYRCYTRLKQIDLTIMLMATLTDKRRQLCQEKEYDYSEAEKD